MRRKWGGGGGRELGKAWTEGGEGRGGERGRGRGWVMSPSNRAGGTSHPCGRACRLKAGFSKSPVGRDEPPPPARPAHVSRSPSPRVESSPLYWITLMLYHLGRAV
ncbi:hypothetical protein H6P81_020814 [Aristolochia fimbriata]|uniref:Uncharacterized protein n=1 Tax=Aristolochia fimbriata TaxID=158543 RepID=A0AAV7DXC3_ARIFI|nr:hypothetical protein H6P81_020814 [Aristolochia fimbriata]